MSRLPVVGQDNGTWGGLLNDFLGVEHNADGTLKSTGTIATKQALNANLTAISAITPTANDILQYKSGSWTNRTPAQLKVDLALSKTDVGLSNADNTSDANKPVSTAAQAAINAKTVVTVGTIAGADYVCDGTDDNVQIQAAIDAVAAAGGGTVFVKAGTYSLSATLVISSSNVHLTGEGMGITKLVCAASMTGNTEGLRVYNSTAGSDILLTADTAVGQSTVAVTSAAGLTVGDWILLKSNKSVDSENAAKRAGELHYIRTIVGTTVTLNDVVKDTYLTTDSAAITKITMLHNVTWDNMSISSLAPSSSLNTGFVHCWFVDNLTIRSIEMHDAFVGMQLVSCVNSVVESCYIHNINDVTPSSNLRYGVWVCSASENITIADCRFYQTRHSVTTGGSSGTNRNGVQRNLTVTGCTSMQSDTAHFDTHEPIDGATFTGNTAIGGYEYSGAGATVHGFQIRGRNTVIANNVIKDIPGRGIMVFNSTSIGVASGITITGNNISNIKMSASTSDGIGIYFDSGQTTRHLVTNNYFKDCDNRAIYGASSGSNPGANDTNIADNFIDNCPASASASGSTGIYLSNAQRVSITGNKIINNSFGRPIQMSGTSSGWVITDNFFYNNSINFPALVGSNNSVFNNYGVNHIGPYAVGNITGSATFNRINGSVQSATLTGDVGSVTVTAGQNVGDELTLILTQDAVGSHVVTWPSNVKPAQNGTLVITPTANAIDIVTFIWDGTNWREKNRALAASASVAWGNISGTLSGQTDLQNALNAKAAAGTNSDITSLQAASLSITSPIVKGTKTVALTDAATIATDASLGNIFTVTLGGNRTLGNPTNPTDGQKCIWRIKQDGSGNRTIALDTAFRLGTDQASVTLSTTLNKTDYIGAIYNGTDSVWDIIAFTRGF